MDLTINLATQLHSSPFEMMAQEVDEVVLLLNYYLEKAEQKNDQIETSQEPTVKHNDGFWDF